MNWSKFERYGLGGLALAGLLWMMKENQDIERERMQFHREYMRQQTEYMRQAAEAIEDIKRTYVVP